MTDASPAGWVVQVSNRAEPEASEVRARWRPAVMLLGAPSFKYLNVAIAAPDEAMDATKKYLAKGDGASGELSIVRKLSSREVASLSLKAGEIKPA